MIAPTLHVYRVRDGESTELLDSDKGRAVRLLLDATVRKTLTLMPSSSAP